jgi:hypothetical protein
MAGRRREKKLKATFLKQFGELRAEYRKFDSLALLDEIVAYINHGFSLGDVEHLKKAPWAQLLLIKWILIDVDFKKGNLKPTQADANAIMHKIWALQSKARLPTDYPDVHLFMRSMGNQQLSYQQSFSNTCFGRQKLLFCDLPINHTFHLQFQELTGVTMQVFLELAFAVRAVFNKINTPRFKQEVFKPLEKKYSSQGITSFLNSISMDLDNLQEWLIEVGPDKREVAEYYLETPLYDVPLLRKHDEYMCWYPTVLYRHLETCIYDKLKALNPSGFMDKFGAIFERYLGDTIKLSGALHVTENDIKPLIGDAKCIDFVIYENDNLILIDAKGVEMSDAIKTTHRPELIRDRTKNTIIKAIEQAYSVCCQLEKLSSILPVNVNEVVPYVLVVTYKEHYLGNGETFSKVVASEKITRIKEKYPNANIPLEHMYFITIDDFDLISESVRKGETTYSEFLTTAVEADKSNETTRFSFQMHLASEGCTSSPEHITKVNRGLLDSLKTVL